MWFLLCALVQVASITKDFPANQGGVFCSAHLCKLLRLFSKKVKCIHFFCSAHLCKLLQDFFISSFNYIKLLLCALVQVASLLYASDGLRASLLLCALVQVASIYLVQVRCKSDLLLCALVQVASYKRGGQSLPHISSALRTCASCFAKSHGIEVAYVLLLCALVQVASVEQFEIGSIKALLLCALVQVASLVSTLYVVEDLLLLCALVQVASNEPCGRLAFVSLLLCALVQVASAKLHSSLRQAVEAICIGAQLHIISKCELPFNSTIDSNDMIVRRANLSWQQ